MHTDVHMPTQATIILIYCMFRSFLRTLDHRNLSNGAAEMLKMACIKDAELFNLLETHGERFIFSGFQVLAAILVCLCQQDQILT